MLVGLRLENIALIDSLELSFNKGFSVFTGETGAGKSIFLDAIDLLLGGGQSATTAKLIQSGSNKASIEGCFHKSNLLQEWLSDNYFDVDSDEFYITREMKLRDDKWSTRFRLNGSIINRRQILELRPYLIDFTIQGQVHAFNLANKQFQWIDKFGSNKIKDVLSKVKSSWTKWNLANNQLEKEKINIETSKKKLEEMKNFILDLDNANINDPLEYIQLIEKQDKLVHVLKLQQTIALILCHLKEASDQQPTALEHLSICIKELKMLCSLDNSLSSKLDEMMDLYADLDRLNSSLDEYYMSLESNPHKLQEIQERILLLKRIQTRYDLNLEDLISRKYEYQEIVSLQDHTIQLEKLTQNVELLQKERDQDNALLTKSRMQVALEFENILMKYLKSLGLKNVQFKAKLEPCMPSDQGADKVTFLFSANPDHALSPLTEIASGGEMSRVLLALKTALAQVDGSSTLIFDEIDAGVSGRISSAIARLLKELSLHKQVFCVTHQPLVAAIADHHFSVSKTLQDGVTRSSVNYLKDFQDRQKELAELAGGNSKEATIYAASLLENKAA